MVKVKWLGHSTFQIKNGGYTLLIDPFISDNPKTSASVNEICADYILVTHGHHDHLGDSIEIAKRCDAIVITTNELGHYLESKGCCVKRMHIGGGDNFDFGRVILTKAFHGSSVIDEKSNIIYTGMPCGFIVQIDGVTIYHAGDTGLFGDMKLLGERYDIDLALLPIGDVFTMGVRDAAYAVGLLEPRIALPMHYKTWPVIDQSPDLFAEMAQRRGTEIMILEPGEEIEL